MAKKVDVEVVKDVLKKIGREKCEVDVNNNKALLNYLFIVCQHIISTSGSEWKTVGKDGKCTNLKDDVKTAKAEAKEALNTADYSLQRNLKGNFILTSPPNVEKGWKSLFEPHDEQDTRTLTERTLDLVQECYGVRIPESDITAVHELKNNSVLLKIWNRKNGSPYFDLVSAVKRGGVKKSDIPKNGGGALRGEGVKNEGYGDQKEGEGDKKEGEDMTKKCDSSHPGPKVKSYIPRQRFFINFQLTKNRYKILGHIKFLKKKGSIHKFDTNQNGDINMTVKEGEKPVWLTYYPKSENSFTYTISDIDSYLPKHVGVKSDTKPKYVKKN